MQKATLKSQTQEDLQWVQNAYKAGLRLIAIFKLRRFLRRKKNSRKLPLPHWLLLQGKHCKKLRSRKSY